MEIFLLVVTAIGVLAGIYGFSEDRKAIRERRHDLCLHRISVLERALLEDWRERPWS